MFAEQLSRVLNCRKWLILLQRSEPTKKFISKTKYTRCHFTDKALCFNFYCHEKYFFSCYSLQQIHTVPQVYNFVSAESNYARSVLSNSDVYSNSLAVPVLFKEDMETEQAGDLTQESWNQMTNSEVLENFQLLSQFAHKHDESIEDLKYKNILEFIGTKCSEFNDKELNHLLSCLEFWNIPKNEPSLKRLIEIIDTECLKRISNWTIDDILLINDHFYKLNLMNSSKFTKISLQRINPRKMTAANLVQFAFLLRVMKRLPINLNRFEDCIEKYVNELTIEEIAIIAMTFFKYETRMSKQSILSKFMNKLIINLKSINDISLAAFLKMFRYSLALETMNMFNILLMALEDEVENRQLLTLTHIAHLQGTLLLDNKNLTLKILNKFEKEIKSARIKDIERMIFTLCSFNFDPKETSFYETAINELMDPVRVQETFTYPKCLVYSVLYMLQVNFYPEEALKKILHPYFVNKFSNGDIKTLDREYLVIDYCLEIDHPAYDGPRLKKHIIHYLLKKFGESSLMNEHYRVNHAQKFLIDVTHSLKQLFESSSSLIHIDTLLPHFFAKDIVLCFSPENNKFISTLGKICHLPPGTIKYAPKDGNKWYVLVLASANQLTRNYNQQTGVMAMRLRHLKHIGYTPILIPNTEWQNLSTSKRKQEYLKNVLYK